MPRPTPATASGAARSSGSHAAASRANGNHLAARVKAGTVPPVAEKEPIVFDAAVEGLYIRGLREQLTPALKQKLKVVGIELEPKIKPAYPRSAWVKGIEVLSTELYP